jgi:hypothetical protein
MIYAPPSREKSKQTMRSPMMDKNGGLNISQVTSHLPISSSSISGVDEYMMQGNLYSAAGSMSQNT